VDYILSLAEAGLSETRALIFELRPESLESEGLVAAIEKQVAATGARYGLSIQADLSGEPDIPLKTKEALYRIAQEALNNVVKHARASAVRLALAIDDGRVQLSVEDNGVGFDPGGDFAGHLGLRSMAERARNSGGDLRITSEPGKGARVAVTFEA
jgi:signal transduction histidine kinase